VQVRDRKVAVATVEEWIEVELNFEPEVLEEGIARRGICGSRRRSKLGYKGIFSRYSGIRRREERSNLRNLSASGSEFELRLKFPHRILQSEIEVLSRIQDQD
jgi:hypothetical protein